MTTDKRSKSDATDAARVARYRKRLVAEGLVPVTVWVRPEQADAVREMDARAEERETA